MTAVLLICALLSAAAADSKNHSKQGAHVITRKPPPPQTKKVRSFQERYPSPVISKIPTPLPGVEIWAVFDRSQEAEDPITQSYWLSAGGDPMELSIVSVSQTLLKLGYFPKSEEEALAIAQLPYMGDSTTVVTHPKSPPDRFPEKARSLIQSPRVRKEDGAFVVQFDLFQDPSRHWHRSSDEDSKFVTRYELQIHPSLGMTLRSRASLWPPEERKSR